MNKKIFKRSQQTIGSFGKLYGKFLIDNTVVKKDTTLFVIFFEI